MGRGEQRVRQTTITLPYYDDEVPILSEDQSMLYTPLIALCEMLELYMFYGIWTVCYSTRETETSLHLLPGWFLHYTDRRDHLFYPRGSASGIS